MDYIDVRILLFQQKQLSIQEAVDIINSWRASPLEYYKLLQTENASISLWGYDYYSEEDDCYIFTETDKKILSPKLAYKFFELKQDSLTEIFLQTINALTFVEEQEDIDDEEEAEEYDNEREYVHFHWPYFDTKCVAVLSGKVIANILEDWHYVFDCQNDISGDVYNLMYMKLKEEDRCCDVLAVNSFNLNSWLTKIEHPVELRARHYIMSNFSLEENGEGETPYFRKLLVRYLNGIWVNFDNVIKSIITDQAIRNN